MDKISTIRYIIYRMAQEFNGYRKRDADDIDFFNAHNHFTLERCLMLPYVISMLNARKDETPRFHKDPKNFFLDGIFKDSFYPHLEDNNNYVVIGEMTDDSFNIYGSNDLNLEFNQHKNLVHNFKENEFDFASEATLPDEQCLSYNINYSIKFMSERRYDDFAVISEKLLKRITSGNSAFNTTRALASQHTFSGKELAHYFNLSARQAFNFIRFNNDLENDVDRSALRIVPRKFEYAGE